MKTRFVSAIIHKKCGGLIAPFFTTDIDEPEAYRLCSPRTGPACMKCGKVLWNRSDMETEFWEDSEIAEWNQQSSQP